VGSYIFVNKKLCADYVSIAVTDPARQTAICDKFPFTDLDKMREIVAATYVGGAYLDTFKADSGMTDDELLAFFKQDNSASFGGLVKSQVLLIATHLACNAESATGCSSVELANRQWGESLVTNNIYPAYQTSPFLKASISAKDWGIISKPAEYNYYSLLSTVDNLGD
jgi:hypothetical protein